MALKYLVVQTFEDSNMLAELFRFDDPMVALEVCRQLRDKNNWYDYCVVVEDA